MEKYYKNLYTNDFEPGWFPVQTFATNPWENDHITLQQHR